MKKLVLIAIALLFCAPNAVEAQEGAHDTGRKSVIAHIRGRLGYHIDLKRRWECRKECGGVVSYMRLCAEYKLHTKRFAPYNQVATDK